MQASDQFPLLYPDHSPSLDAAPDDVPWSPSADHHLQPSLSRSIYTLPEHSPDANAQSISYSSSASMSSSASSSYYGPIRHYPALPNQHQLSPSAPEHHSNSLPPHFTQIEPSGGPDRVLTRRQRAALQQGALTRRTSTPADFPRMRRTSSTAQHSPSSMYFPPPPELPSRPQTPSSAPPTNQFDGPPEDQLSLSLSAIRNPQLQSPCFPSTPASTSSSYSPYNYFSTRHSRSNSLSNSTNPRSASPALSIASALTSVSGNSSSAPPLPDIVSNIMSPLAAARPKQRKQRLFNVDRKAICQYHQENPNARQEDIAVRYGVERSTISKILKYKQKWLNVPEHEGMRIAKHRPSKFPEVEEILVEWLHETREKNVMLSDAAIRAKARQTAKTLHISDDKFKASSGWVENFKHRHGIRRGIWQGDGKNMRAARALGAGTIPPGLMPSTSDTSVNAALSPLNPAFDVNPGAVDTSMDADISAHSPGYDDDPSLSSIDHSLEHHDHHREDGEPSMSSWQSHPPPQPADGDVHGVAHPADDISHHHHDSAPIHHHHHILTDGSIPQNDHHPPPPPPIHQEQQLEQPVMSFDNEPYESTSHYQPLSSGQLPPPSIEEVEVAINKVIDYLNSEQGNKILQPQEMMLLVDIKCALFSHANGVPYVRPRESTKKR